MTIKFSKLIQLILEDRVSDLKKKYPSDEVDRLALADPHRGKKHLAWLLKNHSGTNIPLHHIKGVLSDFMKPNHPKAEPISRDISNYSHIDDVANVDKPHNDLRNKKKAVEQARRELVTNEGNEIHNSPNLVVHNPQTREASCELGMKTKWCTSAKNNNMFPSHHAFGDFYVIRGKDKDGKNAKYGVHFEGVPGPPAGQQKPDFMNAENKPVDTKELVRNNPELKTVNHWQFKHPDFTTDENNAKLKKMGNFSAEEADSTIKNKGEHPNYRVKAIQAHAYKVPTSTIRNVANDENEHHEVRSAAIKNLLTGDLSNEDIHKMMKNPKTHVRIKKALMENHKGGITQEHIDDIMKDKDVNNNLLKTISLARYHKFIKPEHVESALQNEDPNIKMGGVIHHRLLTPEKIKYHGNRIANDKNAHSQIRGKAMNDMLSKDEQKATIHRSLSDKTDDHHFREEIIKNHLPKISPEEIEAHKQRILSDETEHPEVRQAFENHSRY